MPTYQPPVDDCCFILDEVLKVGTFNLSSAADLDSDVSAAILAGAAQFNAEVLAPTNITGDREGARLVDGEVVTPTGFKDAYVAFRDGGWPSLIALPEHGGQGLPHYYKTAFDEMLGGANMAFAMCPATMPGVYDVLRHHASQEIQNLYLPKIASGDWTTAMSLTEPQCGSALGLIRTRATPHEDGTFRIEGSKMWNSWGDHDMTENIVHLVLARLPDAPEGTRGISLFLVPKYLPDSAGKPAIRNAFGPGSLEHKMGIHGSPTCVTNFDCATGWIIGAPNKGLTAMFVLMNTMRLATGTMAVGMATAAYQHASSYAKERLAGRSATGAKYPDLPGDPIVVHPDVRRMLMMQRSFCEGARMLCLWIGLELEKSRVHEDAAQREQSDRLVSLLTPVVKAFLSDKAFESIDLALQCYGGHGYSKEWPVEQFLRDERMLRLGEGTSGIQAMDLLARKVLGDDFRAVNEFISLIRTTAEACRSDIAIETQASALLAAVSHVERLHQDLGEVWRKDMDETGAASFDYLYLIGYLALGFLWLKALQAAETANLAGLGTPLHRQKRAVGAFFFSRVLPEFFAAERKIRSGAASLVELDDDDL